MKRFSPTSILAIISLIVSIASFVAVMDLRSSKTQPQPTQMDVVALQTSAVETFVVDKLIIPPTDIITPFQSRTPKRPFYLSEDSAPSTPQLEITQPPIEIGTQSKAIFPTSPATLNENCPPPQTPQTGMVVDVIDGDTIKVNINGKDYSVRYIGMDTPESTFQHEAFGKEASAKNKELVAGKTVTLYRDKSETDRFDRLLRYVFVDSLFINRELVATGFADAKDYPPDTSCSITFHAAEQVARAALLGKWASIPPRDSTEIAQPQATSTQLALIPTQPIAGSLTIVTVNKQAEYVIIKNEGPNPVDLTGWTLLSEKGPQSCPLGGTIQPGSTLHIWAMTGDGFSCNFAKEIWNNSESDPAVLLNPQGEEISRK